MAIHEVLESVIVKTERKQNAESLKKKKKKADSTCVCFS